jgi:AcrR family transcriptional regulator
MPAATNSKRVKHTKELIRDAAMELLAEYGYKGTSVRKIASNQRKPTKKKSHF